jgi:chemotaxis regulatin CheY-phosphate phosphatase CheZ
MSQQRALTRLDEADYEAIEQAVMETSRGRWFLAEYARRNRHADTNQLLDAMSRLESAVNGQTALQQIERVRFDLFEMARSITGLKSELSHDGPDGEEQTRFNEATSALDDIVRTTEHATSTILGAAESIQEAAWNLRELAVDEATCDKIDRLATEIYTACAFQDLTAQRTQKVVRTLRFLEGRINALIDAWSERDGATTGPRQPAPGPIDDNPILSQSDIDFVIVESESDPELPPFASVAEENMPDNVRQALSVAEAMIPVEDLREDAPVPLEKIPVAAPASTLVDVDGCDIVEIDDLELTPIDGEEPVVRAGPTLADMDAMPSTARILMFS